MGLILLTPGRIQGFYRVSSRREGPALSKEIVCDEKSQTRSM
jgi:hypothetical protein